MTDGDDFSPPSSKSPSLLRPRFVWEINLGHIMQMVAVALVGGMMTFFLAMRTDVQNLATTSREHEVRLTALERSMEAQDKRYQAASESMHREFTAYQAANQADVGVIKQGISDLRVLLERYSNGRK